MSWFSLFFSMFYLIFVTGLGIMEMGNRVDQREGVPPQRAGMVDV